MRILLIVPRDALKLLEFLEKKFKGDQGIGVTQDRRAGQRRTIRSMPKQERRRHDRRGVTGDRMLLQTETITTTPAA